MTSDDYTNNDYFIAGFLEGIGITLICVALWLKHNGEYVLIKKKKGFFK